MPAVASPTATHREGDRALFGLFVGLLAWAPIPLGSNRPWSWALLEITIFALCAAWTIQWLRGRVAITGDFIRAWPAIGLFASWTIYCWMQLLDIPPALLGMLSPESARWHATARLPEAAWAAPLTLDRYATYDGACLTSAYAAFFGLSLLLLRSASRLRMIGYTLVASGVVQAIYGTIIDPPAGGALVHGTFVNRNHFGGYLLLCLSTGTGLLVGSLKGGTWDSARSRLRDALAWMLADGMVLRLALLVMVVALVLSRSRMANTAFFSALLVIGTLSLFLSRRAPRSMIVLLASLVVLDIAIIGTYFGVQEVADKIAHTSISTEDRDEVAAAALRFWNDFRWLGAGLGSFRSVFPRYNDETTSSAYTHAHNDYLEFLCESGVVGVALLGLLVATSFTAAALAQHRRRSPLMRGISFGAMMGMVAFLIQAAVEFNFQIPANALTFVLVLALAWLSLSQPSPAPPPAR